MERSFTVNQKQLATMLASMQPICAKRTTLDTTASILFQAGNKELTLKSTDLEISLQYSCALPLTGLEEGQTFLVSGRRVFEIIKELDGDIVVDVHAEKIALNAGSVKMALNIQNAQDFPPFPERIENLMHLNADFLRRLLDQVAFLIPQNNANPALNGLFIEIDSTGLKATATDGHCLVQVASAAHTLAEPCTWLVPRRAIFELKKILEMVEDTTIFLGTCGNQLVFSGDSFNFFTKLLAEPFPTYQPIMDTTGFYAGTANRQGLIKTLRRAACLLSGQFIATVFTFDTEQVRVAMTNKEVGNLEETLALDSFAGPQLEMRFYAPYLLNGLQAMTGDTVSFALCSGVRPIILQGQALDCNFTYLVMPVSPAL